MHALCEGREQPNKAQDSVEEAGAVWRPAGARQPLLALLRLEAIVVGELLPGQQVEARKEGQPQLPVHGEDLGVEGGGAAVVLRPGEGWTRRGMDESARVEQLSGRCCVRFPDGASMLRAGPQKRWRYK